MSEMVLRMPSNYVNVDNNEMEYVDGGMYSAVSHYWWGDVVLMDHEATTKMANYFNTAAQATALAGGVAALVSLGFGKPVVSTVIGLVAGISAAYYGLLGTRLTANDNGRGVELNINKTFAFWTIGR